MTTMLLDGSPQSLKIGFNRILRSRELDKIPGSMYILNNEDYGIVKPGSTNGMFSRDDE